MTALTINAELANATYRSTDNRTAFAKPAPGPMGNLEPVRSGARPGQA